MKTVVWNLQRKAANWRALGGHDALAGSDICLLSEAPPAPAGMEAFGLGTTEGLEVALGPERPVKRPWSAAIASPHRIDPIEDPRLDRYYHEPLPFRPSRPGTWAAAVVHVDGVRVTAVSLYGLLDERSDASVHRSLSELSPIFDHKSYGKHLVLGDDLNILANPRPKDPARDRHLAVLSRIRAYGLEDCLEKATLEGRPPRKRPPKCPCGLGSGCTHTWTHRHGASASPTRTTTCSPRATSRTASSAASPSRWVRTRPATTHRSSPCSTGRRLGVDDVARRERPSADRFFGHRRPFER